jgi:predicted PilT family ATPase
MDQEDRGGVIGKGGKTIDLIEKKLGLHLDIRVRKKEKVKSKKKDNGIKSFVPVVERSKKYVVLTVKGSAVKPQMCIAAMITFLLRRLAEKGCKYRKRDEHCFSYHGESCDNYNEIGVWLDRNISILFNSF